MHIFFIYLLDHWKMKVLHSLDNCKLYFLIKKSNFLDIYFLVFTTSRFIEKSEYFLKALKANAIIKHKDLSQIHKKQIKSFITDYFQKGLGDQECVSSIGRLSAKQSRQRSETELKLNYKYSSS